MKNRRDFTLNKDPVFTEHHVAYLSDWLLNHLLVNYSECKCFEQCCLVKSLEKDILEKLTQMMEEAMKSDESN